MKSLTTLKSTLLFVCTASDTSVSGWTSSYSRVNPRRRRFHRSSHLSMQDLVNDDTKINPPLEPSESSNSFSCDERYPGGEVVGSTGKIGSFLLHRLNQQSSRFFDASKYPQSLNVAATPRGVAPGCLSPPNTPIYACIPSSSIQDVWESTVPHRRDDLVFICNCVPSRHLSFGGSEENDEENSDFSVVIPHFGVPHIRPSSERISLTPVVHTSATSPPTVIYGKHADSLAKLLRNDDIPVQIVRSPQGIQVAAVRKLIWASLMWLICHDNGDSSPLTVKEAHEKKASDLERLVEEILPSLKMLSVEAWTNREGLVKGEESHKEYISIGTVETIVEYLKAYSMSLSDGNVTPSKDLAMVEIHERNMLFIALKLMTACTSENLPSDFHTDMICRVIGQEKFQKCLEDVSATKNISRKATRIQTSQRVRFVSSDLEFLVHPTKIDKNTLLESESGVDKSVVIVGAGMVGSSIAYHLSQQPGIQVTVLDQKCNILPNTPDEIIDPGIATSSTFAWLNANDKSPLSYMHLNKMGMESWRRHVLLKDLPVWCGSIVRKKCLQDVEIDVEKILFTEKNKSHYSRIGPLTAEEVSRLEPGVAFKSPTTKATDDATSTENQNEEIYFYPEEGHVNPASAVKLLRKAANSNGVKFVGGIQLQELMRDNINGKINGVKIKRQGSDNLEVMSADIVVISAGANSSEPILGIGSDRLPLLHQPGALAYVQSASSGIDVDKRLKRIVVDTFSQSHILRRLDGTLVIGGGQLVVGGSEDLTLERQSSDSLMSNVTEWDDKLVGEKMIESVASNIAPLELLTAEAKINRDAMKISRANRPMPSDGLPVVGAIESGLYVTVSHSAMTLGLVLGELSAHEILRIVQGYDQPDDEKLYGFKIFDSYRPHRFWRRDS